MGVQAVMTEAELDELGEIQKRIAARWTSVVTDQMDFGALTQAQEDAGTLLAIMARLRRVIFQLEAHIEEQGAYHHQLIGRHIDALEIARAVATFDDDDSYDGAYKCHWCSAMYDGIGDNPPAHTAACLITKARALLASKDE